MPAYENYHWIPPGASCAHSGLGAPAAVALPLARKHVGVALGAGPVPGPSLGGPTPPAPTARTAAPVPPRGRHLGAAIRPGLATVEALRLGGEDVRVARGAGPVARADVAVVATVTAQLLPVPGVTPLVGVAATLLLPVLPDRNLEAVQLGAVQLLDGGLRLFGGLELHNPAALGRAIGALRHGRVRHVARLLEEVLQSLPGGVVR
mmetsp:Transcript_375/g.963  ORF Transcript_375/g.963 Transcript_375/m.963 type:complete len:206 (-) Transcript_375:764-1381(-)